MADNWLGSFAVALGFQVDTGSLNTAKKSIADYEAAVKAAEKRIEDARWAGAKSEQEIAKITRETNLKEAKDALAAAQQREKVEAEQLKKREQHAKEFVSAWNRMALAATAAATAISYAVTTVTRSFDNLGFVSQRTGASVQALNSLSYAFKQVGGTSDQAVGAVESFAKALRENSGVKSYVQSLGVDMTADTAQQLLQTVEKLNAHPYDVGFREAGLAGISEENYNLISRQLTQIKAYRAEYDAMTKSLGVNSKDATDASMAFQRSLNRLQATASALSDKLLVSLAPALKAIVDRFQDWIRSNPEKVERIMDGISKAVVWVAEKIGALVQSFTGSNGDEFMKRWEAFGTRVQQLADNIERIANGIEKISRFLSWASGTKTVLGDPQRTADILNQMRAERESGVSFDAQRERKDPDAGLSGLARRAWRATKRALGGGAAEAHTDGVGSAGAPAESDEVVTTHGHRWKPGSNTAAGRERVASWLQFFQAPIKEGGLGTDAETARAMVAMMQGESDASLRPDAKGDPRNGVPTAFGTAQWRLERFEALKAMAARMKTEWTDVGAQQQHFRNEVLNGKYRGVWNRILSAPTGEQKLRAGIEGFEVPKYPGKAYDFRVHYLHALRRAPSPAVAANSGIVVPPPGSDRSSAANGRGASTPNMTPGGFDVNNIDPRSLMKVDPATSPAVMNSTTSSSRSLTQNNTFKVDITGSQTPQEHARAFTQSADGLYALALRNAQSATV